MSNGGHGPAASRVQPAPPPKRTSKVLRLWIISCLILAVIFAAGGLFVGCVVTAPPSPPSTSSPVE